MLLGEYPFPPNQIIWICYHLIAAWVKKGDSKQWNQKYRPTTNLKLQWNSTLRTDLSPITYFFSTLFTCRQCHTKTSLASYRVKCQLVRKLYSPRKSIEGCDGIYGDINTSSLRIPKGWLPCSHSHELNVIIVFIRRVKGSEWLWVGLKLTTGRLYVW